MPDPLPEPTRRVTLTFTANIDLEEDQLWPDGDAPESWTADDVSALIKQCGGALAILRDWDLEDYLEVTVHA